MDTPQILGLTAASRSIGPPSPQLGYGILATLSPLSAPAPPAPAPTFYAQAQPLSRVSGSLRVGLGLGVLVAVTPPPITVAYGAAVSGSRRFRLML